MSLQFPSDTGGLVSKNDLIIGAYSQLRISGITRQPTPEDLETALRRLENMAAELNLRYPVGYNFEDEPDPNSDSGLVRGLAHCFETNLAVRLIPDFNKDVPPALLAQASQSLSGMCSLSAMNRLRQVQYPSRQPIGSGSRWPGARWARYYRTSSPVIQPDIEMFVGDINDYTEHFDAYLRDGEDISSHSIVVDSGIDLISDSLASPNVNYRIAAKNPTTQTNSTLQQITIIVTTTTGRVETKRVFVQFSPRD